MAKNGRKWPKWSVNDLDSLIFVLDCLLAVTDIDYIFPVADPDQDDRSNPHARSKVFPKTGETETKGVRPPRALERHARSADPTTPPRPQHIADATSAPSPASPSRLRLLLHAFP